MEATVKTERTIPFARQEGTRSGSTPDEEIDLLEHSSTLATLRFLAGDPRSVTRTGNLRWPV